MKRLLYLPAPLLLLSMVSSFSSWKIGIRNSFRTRLSIPQHQHQQQRQQHNAISFTSTNTRLLVSNTDDNFEERLRKAYEEWSLTYGDTIDETRMEIFSYHFLMAENYFKETGNRIKLNEYADLTAVEFQRLKEMGGMIQDVGGSDGSNNNNPHWAPDDAAQMDFFAKQTSQRRQTFQDNSQQNQPEDPQPPPGYFSILPTPEQQQQQQQQQGGDPNNPTGAGGMNNMMNNGMGANAPGGTGGMNSMMNNGMGAATYSFNNGIGGGIPAAENNHNPNMGMPGLGGGNSSPPPGTGMAGGNPSAEGVSSFRDPYQQRFTQSYLDSLNIQAKDDLVDQTPNQNQPPPPPPEPTGQNGMYTFGGDNENANVQQDPNKYKQSDSFPPENSDDKPELQDLINSRYDGIGFLEDSAMVGNSGMDYKFFPALSKMYNLDYPDPQQQQNRQQQQRQDMPPPPPPGMPGPMGDGGFTPPPPPGEPSPQDRRENFLNAMSQLYSQMFNEEGGPPDAETFEMMQNFMQQAAGGGPPPGGQFGIPPPPGQFGVPPQPGAFGGGVSTVGGGGGGGGGGPSGQWGAPESGPLQTDEDLYGDNEAAMTPPPPPVDEEEEVGTEVYLGEMSYKMTRGRVIEWLKNIGDEVERGEPLCVVESDTFMMVDGQKYAETHDVVAQEDGLLAAIYIEVGETVPVGSVLGVVAADIAEASLVRQTLEQKKVDFDEPIGARTSTSTSTSSRSEPEDVFIDENGYPVDEDGYLLDSVEVDAEGYPIYDYVDGYPVDEDGYVIEDHDELDADGYPIEDEYDENGGYDYEYEEGGYEEQGWGEEQPAAEDDGFGAESMYSGPVDDDPDLPSWVLGDAPSIAPAKVASRYPVIPKMNRPAPPPPPPKKVASRQTPKRSVPKGGRRPGPQRPRGRIDDVRSPARKNQAAVRAEKPKIEGTELTLSELSYGMTKATVIEWIKKAGDPVKKGEPLAVVESDTFMVIDGQKYAESHDVVASQDGILAATYAGEKETLEVGALLGIIADNEMAARNVPQSNPYGSGASVAAAEGPDKPMSRTQRFVADAIQASTDPEQRPRGANMDAGFLDSVEQVEEDVMAQMGGGPSEQQQNDEFAKRFMSQEERQAADFAAAGSYGGGGGGEQYNNEAIDDPDLPSWVRGDAPSLAPAKVASKFPVIPKMGQPGGGTSPSANAIKKAREATMQQQQQSQMYDKSQTPPGRMPASTPRGSVAAPPPQRRGAPPKRRGAPPKRRGERPSGRGRIDDTRAPLNQPQEDEGTEIVLSELSYGMKKGMIIEWLKNVGDPVKKGEPIAVVESDTFMVIDTQKYAESHDILATEDGILATQLGGPKELFDVGAVLGTIANNEAQMRNMRRSSPPPPSQADANGYSGYADASSFVPEETNEAGENYYPPPDPREAAAAGGDNYLDDPDLPSWVRGDAPSIAPAKVASKYPVIPNMRRGAPPPQSTPNPPRTPPAPLNGGTQRRIPKGRYDDTRARPKEIRVIPSNKTRPRGRIDDVRAPLNAGGGSSYTAPEPTNSDSKLFPNLSTPKSPKSTNRITPKATPKATQAPPPEETRFMPDLSSTLKPKKKKTVEKKGPPIKPPAPPPSPPPPTPIVDTNKETEDLKPEPEVEEPIEEPVVAEEESITSETVVKEVVHEETLESAKEDSPEPINDEGVDTVEEDVVESLEDLQQQQEDLPEPIKDEGVDTVEEDVVESPEDLQQQQEDSPEPIKDEGVDTVEEDGVESPEDLQQQHKDSPEPTKDEGVDTVEEDVVESPEDLQQEPDEEDVQPPIVDEEEGEEALIEEDAQLEAGGETMVDASDEIEASNVEDTEDISDDLVSEDINGDYVDEDGVDMELEVEEESSSDEVEVLANGEEDIQVEEGAEEDVAIEEAEESIVEDSEMNVTAKVDIRDLKKENTSPPKETSTTAETFDFQEAATNSTDAMVQEILVTAKARTAADEAKIDLTTLKGTGEDGCITLDDVKLAIARKKPKIGIRFLTDKPKGRPNKKDK
ncbi:unnamed protein product [Cylindrotheca closterium]|uniref:Lipoyl-binding domain-containing protein n=1 Tax=Cylindrotheca closterium TaxID=2856 RepID=A0AAD2G246_9STRA|nr:unnamed protein product [Cylindrotheca closterium]